MSQIMKAFTGVLMALLMMLTSTGILGMFLQIVQAQNVHAMMLEELENSDFSRRVLLEAFNMAEAYGYGLEIALFREDETEVYCRESTELPSDLSDVFMAEVILDYSVRLSFSKWEQSKGCAVMQAAKSAESEI